MSRFLILASSNEATGLALRLQAEGHEVRMWCRDDKAKDVGKGIVNIADDFGFLSTVVDTDNNFGIILDSFRQAGIGTFGGGSFHERLEEDREFAEEVMNDVGIKTPESLRVSSWEDARFAVEKLSGGDKVVIKPEGSLSGVIPSYVASDEADALDALKGFEQKAAGAEPDLVIQQFIKGVALSTEGWFNGDNWIEGMFNHTLEKKEMLNDDLGPSSGCAGNVVWAIDKDSPILRSSLLKLTKTLRKHSYVGPIDINCVVNEEGIYGLEFTPRFGYDAFPTLLYGLCDFDFGWFVVLSSKGGVPDVGLQDGFGAGVRLCLPKDSDEVVSLKGLSLVDMENFYPYGAQFDEQIMSVKKNHDFGVMTGRGDTIDEAFSRVYSICNKLHCKGLSYRTDLGEALLKDFRELNRIVSGEEPEWLGVDLDGTLAKYSVYDDEIGEPIPEMIQRVRRWIAEGKEIRVLTARGTIDGKETNAYEQRVKIHEWVKKHIGHPLEVTHKKDPFMKKLYDDRVQQVEKNTGALV